MALDHRVGEVISLPRAATEEAWCDVQAATFDVRRELGRAVVEHQHQRSPMPRLFAADQRLIRLHDFAKRRAGEVAGISYITPGQESLWDGCLDGDDRAG